MPTPKTQPKKFLTQSGKLLRVKYTGRLFMVAAVTAVMLLAPTVPATASVDSIVFFPGGNGATYSCTDGPPFVFDPASGSGGNCTVEQIGKPAGLVCDDPTPITIVHEGARFVAEGSRCH
jgi:hypothetical protein